MYVEDLEDGATVLLEVIYKESRYNLIGKMSDGRLISFSCDALHVQKGNRMVIKKEGGRIRYIVTYGTSIVPPKEPR